MANQAYVEAEELKKTPPLTGQGVITDIARLTLNGKNYGALLRVDFGGKEAILRCHQKSIGQWCETGKALVFAWEITVTRDENILKAKGLPDWRLDLGKARIHDLRGMPSPEQEPDRQIDLFGKPALV